MRRRLILASLTAALLSLGTARAATEATFGQEAFASAQRAGKPILVFIEASWCPTCAKQRPILRQLSADPAFKDLAIFDVNFDTQKDVVRRFGATMQSTMVVFHGEAEKGRATGQTDPAAIRDLLAKANG
ncbi:MAG: thioredoxin family protein [Alphaproteobacteria bacterium]|nr:thioredoxin family protein [Alphaproteobacteria bacterium]